MTRQRVTNARTGPVRLLVVIILLTGVLIAPGTALAGPPAIWQPVAAAATAPAPAAAAEPVAAAPVPAAPVPAAAAAVAPDPDSPPLTYFGPARQQITVVADSATATTATITAWERTDSGWRTVLGPVRGFVGAAGVGQASEGSTRTPAGVWPLGQAFGRQPNPGTAMPYFRTDSQDWWNGNSSSPAYNTHVRQATDPGNSENLYYIGAVYDYAIDMGYNRARTPGAGSAFFLHVTDGRPTGGCVAIDRAALVSILQWLDPALQPVINIGTAAPETRNPIGYLDATELSGDTARVAGWAIDPDRLRAPVDVHVYDQRPDGSSVGVAVRADLLRPDLPPAFPGVSGNHGYVAYLRLEGPGRHTVCAYAINVESGTGNPSLGCGTLDISPPIGYLDAVWGSPGAVTTAGWAADPTAPGEPVQVRTTVRGPTGVAEFTGSTGGARADVGAAIGWAGGNQGFGATVPVQGEGSHEVCVRAQAVRAPASYTALGCQSLVVRNAFGYLDFVATGPGGFTIGGWALNPNNPGERVEIHVYDEGPAGLRGTPGVFAEQSRPDVAAAFSGYDPDHGFTRTIAADPGQHRFCVYAITTAGGYSNPLLGCRDITVG